MTNETPKQPKRGAPYLGYGSFQALVDARPDLFDDFDSRPPSESTYSDADLLASAPEHLKDAAGRVIERRRAERAEKNGGE